MSCPSGHRSLRNRVCCPFPPPLLPLGPGPGPGDYGSSVGCSGWFQSSEYPARSVRFLGLEWFQRIAAIEKHPLRKLQSIAVVGMYRERYRVMYWHPPALPSIFIR